MNPIPLMISAGYLIGIYPFLIFYAKMRYRIWIREHPQSTAHERQKARDRARANSYVDGALWPVLIVAYVFYNLGIVLAMHEKDFRRHIDRKLRKISGDYPELPDMREKE